MIVQGRHHDDDADDGVPPGRAAVTGNTCATMPAGWRPSLGKPVLVLREDGTAEAVEAGTVRLVATSGKGITP